MDTQKLLEELGKTPYGDALKKYLAEELKEIGDVSKASSWEDTIGRQYAIKLVNKLFSFLSPKETVKKKKTSYR